MIRKFSVTTQVKFKTPQSVQLRSQVKELVKTDFGKSLQIARTIPDGWYRCQSLAAVAMIMKSSKPEFLKIVKEALQAAEETKQPNRIVSASSWIIWVLAKREEIQDTEIFPIVEQMLTIIRDESNPVRRADALFHLFEAVYSRKVFRAKVLNQLLDNCQEMNSWKKPRMLGDIVLVLAVDDMNSAKIVLGMIEKESKKQKLLKEIEENKWLGAHDFLPYYTKNFSN